MSLNIWGLLYEMRNAKTAIAALEARNKIELEVNKIDVLSERVAQLERERDDLRAELEKIQDTEVELPKPFFGMGRYLGIAGTRDAYTKEQLRDYGDKRAAHARNAAKTELDEQLHINSMGAEREYVLLGKIAQLERTSRPTRTPC